MNVAFAKVVKTCVQTVLFFNNVIIMYRVQSAAT